MIWSEVLHKESKKRRRDCRNNSRNGAQRNDGIGCESTSRERKRAEKPGRLWCRPGEYVYVEKMRKRSPLQHNVVLALKGHCIATVLKGQNVYNPQRELGVGDHPTRFIAPTGRNRAGAR